MRRIIHIDGLLDRLDMRKKCVLKPLAVLRTYLGFDG